MQTASEQNPFNATDKKVRFTRWSVAGLKMEPAERKLALRLFAGGLVVSGLMLLGVYALGL